MNADSLSFLRVVRRFLQGLPKAVQSINSGHESAQAFEVLDNDGKRTQDRGEGAHSLNDAPDAKDPIWSETETVTFDQGYYSVSLGAVTPWSCRTL